MTVFMQGFKSRYLGSYSLISSNFFLGAPQFGHLLGHLILFFVTELHALHFKSNGPPPIGVPAVGRLPPPIMTSPLLNNKSMNILYNFGICTSMHLTRSYERRPICYNQSVMNKTVYKHLLATYGRQPGVWIGLLGGIVRPLILVTFTGFATAQLAASIAAGDTNSAQQSIWYLFLLNVFAALATAVGELVGSRAEEAVYGSLQVRYHQKLVSKDMSFYRDNQTGYLTSLFRQYQDNGMLLVRSLRTEVARVTVTLLAPVVVLWVTDWRLGLVSLAIILVQLVYVVWSSAKANKYRLLSHEVYRKTTAEVTDQITNIVAFKSSGYEEAGHKKVADLTRQETHTFWLRRRLTTALDLPRGIMTAAGLVLAFEVIVQTPGTGPQTVGLLVLTLTYMLSIIRNVGELPSVMMRQDDLVTKLYPTLEYLNDTHETVKDPAKPKKLHIKTGEINIQHVSFGYPSHSKGGQMIKVFDDLNLTIGGGEHVGIVGLSGAGKSTLASLLMRFDDVVGGHIAIDGIDIRTVAQSDLRSHVAYVPQEPLLFHRTIRENIAYFNRDATEAQIERAARAAHAHEFIQRLPDGLDTVVGERGLKLSGGQKQRIVIARSILKNAPIMLFDEATSALDSESEKIIQQALPHIMGKHTAIVIAHRLSTLADMDRIIVMHAGEVIEEGSHEELLRLKGRYFSLWQKQVHNQ